MPIEESQIFKIQTYERCLCTVLRNASSAPRFVLVPWHGTTIGPGEEYAFIGGLDAWLQRKRYATRRSFTKALNTANSLQLLQLPLPHSYYTVSSTLYIYTLSTQNNAGNPALRIAEPCWKPT